MNENEKNNDQEMNNQDTEQTPNTQSEQQNNSYREQYLRLNADLQNFKKRVEKERGEWMQLAQISILKAFIPTIDDLQRAISTAQTLHPSAGDGAQPNAWLEGFILIEKNLNKQLTDLGVIEIDCSGTFNPELHEALMQVDAPTISSGTIVAILNKGYIYQGKVIRHAQVSVAK